MNDLGRRVVSAAGIVAAVGLGFALLNLEASGSASPDTSVTSPAAAAVDLDGLAIRAGNEAARRWLQQHPDTTASLSLSGRETESQAGVVDSSSRFMTAEFGTGVVTEDFYMAGAACRCATAHFAFRDGSTMDGAFTFVRTATAGPPPPGFGARTTYDVGLDIVRGTGRLAGAHGHLAGTGHSRVVGYALATQMMTNEVDTVMYGQLQVRVPPSEAVR